MKVDKSGFTVLEVMIVVAIIGLLAAIAIPNLYGARRASRYNACLANLKQIEGAKQNWATENRKLSGDTPVDRDLFGPTAYIKEKPVCPCGGVYNLNPIADSARCMYIDHSGIEIK